MKNSVKSILGALMLALFISSSALAQIGIPMGEDPTEMTQMGKEQIDPEDLPKEVVEAISAGEYAQWTVDKAYAISESGTLSYEVHFKNPDGQAETVTYDQNGEVIGA
ncbi:hypothetical protein [Marinoscillum sp.]|uniref:hypothetical protein n=1 Tax=Marinoscillum sp. TaxID=2024838 RepID=UPI003BABA76A